MPERFSYAQLEHYGFYIPHDVEEHKPTADYVEYYNVCSHAAATEKDIPGLVVASFSQDNFFNVAINLANFFYSVFSTSYEKFPRDEDRKIYTSAQLLVLHSLSPSPPEWQRNSLISLLSQRECTRSTTLLHLVANAADQIDPVLLAYLRSKKKRYFYELILEEG